MASETVIATIGEQEWLDPIGDSVQKAVKDAFKAAGPAGGELKDFLHGKWLGHALHPVLTDIPVGAWTGAAAFDVMDMMGSGRELRAGADTLVGLGLLGAIGSAVTGTADWSESYGPARKIGLVHGVLNVAATALYATSFFLRRSRRSRSTGVALSMVGYAIASASAYLGGHLVFGEQMGVDHTATADKGHPEKFAAVMKESDLLERKLTRVDAGGIAVLLFRLNGQIQAIANTCTHLGGPLNEGKLIGDNVVECPWHCSRFSLRDGSVVGGPATFPEPQFEVRTRNGQIEVRAKKSQ
jgi:nitrite reductase/ring-hydroxylating ferredoxin subunit/uncharacterized membrane protein